MRGKALNPVDDIILHAAVLRFADCSWDARKSDRLPIYGFQDLFAGKLRVLPGRDPESQFMAFRISSRVSFVCFPVEHGATCTALKIRAETLLLTSRNTAYTIDDLGVMH